ncbi:hypothetical protein LUZ63_003801 [Rhynchospora breviuscula]|uniref:Uncharacterized protein n=1 Tax=Rhynchospora breviuscula TaxID=2022672 RepID=A0A9Q0HZC7_9POAL|nr:hypothetical protein LUZ63_003801 [Rhynchospora breviuscula]
MEYPKQTNGMTPPPQPAPGYPPVAPPYALPQKQEWSTGLCDCFDDVNNCCLTCWCPCITFGRIAEIVDKGDTTCRAAGCHYCLLVCFSKTHWKHSYRYRSRLRKDYNLQEVPCADICVHFWCEGFALCQMSRELKNRGWDLSLGYHPPATTPPTPQGMIRDDVTQVIEHNANQIQEGTSSEADSESDMNLS